MTQRSLGGLVGKLIAIIAALCAGLPLCSGGNRSESLWRASDTVGQKGYKMQTVELWVGGRDGGLVTTVQIPPFQVLPEVIMWGSRHFMLTQQNADTPIYKEVFCYAVPPVMVSAESIIKTNH